MHCILYALKTVLLLLKRDLRYSIHVSLCAERLQGQDQSTSRESYCFSQRLLENLASKNFRAIDGKYSIEESNFLPCW